ncbi:spore cortex biosynthesis protein YabQ [Halobacillus karajensis]|uniref:Spore protein YabQ n=1 Tax=Halobacillus karajensis TaxID=195088 RepID=A0A024PAE2_9BACI|nr:spore cortex biosynthesis protein YabQ [Halobacillus karajensis]CDQ21787.1 Spore protein YabQ [Halobacillus karajensis]CDQ25783.1 Spore protein YabQ [Halobacillus karajensis]CDQ29784.1 Spore protein YabQ [Halobacillus karajensis]SEI12395.1 spore cortex biosynthesis protein YabQ [Halobacillus karajensis]
MTLTTQFITILSMIGGGVFVGASMDTFERFFHKRKKKSWLEVIYQLGFWLIQAAFLFYLLYLANYGELRVYVFVAIVCGFAAYRALFQNLYLKTLEMWIRIVVSVIRFIKKTGYYLIFLPAKTIIFLIISLLLGVYKILLKGIILLFLVAFYPIRLAFRIIWRLLPKNMKIYLRHLAGFLDKMKNTMNKWMKRIKK